MSKTAITTVEMGRPAPVYRPGPGAGPEVDRGPTRRPPVRQQGAAAEARDLAQLGCIAQETVEDEELDKGPGPDRGRPTRAVRDQD
jgi:hypothetical protein